MLQLMKTEVLLLDGLHTTMVSGCSFFSAIFFFNVLLLVISLLLIVVHWYLDYCINNQNIQVDYLNVIQVFSFTCLFLSIHVLYSPSQLNLYQWYALGGFVPIHFSTIFSLFTVHLTITCWTFFSKCLYHVEKYWILED